MTWKLLTVVNSSPVSSYKASMSFAAANMFWSNLVNAIILL